ncbi:MAG: hypothetical protein MZV64_34795 [Ignavibacteriales bacterium]|nr:hypothetical protein [Ignavibacteriales bacterium]
MVSPPRKDFSPQRPSAAVGLASEKNKTRFFPQIKQIEKIWREKIGFFY